MRRLEYDGEGKHSLDAIRMEGRRRMCRPCVHLGFAVEKDGKGGGCRGGADAVIVVDVAAAVENGYHFGYTARRVVACEGALPRVPWIFPFPPPFPFRVAFFFCCWGWGGGGEGRVGGGGWGCGGGGGVRNRLRAAWY